MKYSTITTLTLLVLASCNEQVRQNGHTNEANPKYQEIGESFISIGERNSILDCKPTTDNHYFLYLAITKSNTHKQDFYFLNINSLGDSINSLPINFENFLTDYIKHNNYYYVVTTDKRTIGGHTIDFLKKYDKNWKLIWSKKIDSPKHPNGSTVLTMTKNREILLIANDFIPNVKAGILIRRYNLDGKLISENSVLAEEHSNPVSIIPSSDNNFYLTAEQFDKTENINSLWIIKLTQNGDTIWSKKHPHFYPRQTILGSNGNLVFYGSNYSPIGEQKTNYKYLKIIMFDQDGNLKWQKEVKQNYYECAGNFIETKDGNYLFSSTIEPIKDQESRAYIFELSKKGDLTFERKFEYSVGVNSVPYLIRTEGQITMIGQKSIGKFGEPFKDIIQITKLTE